MIDCLGRVMSSGEGLGKHGNGIKKSIVIKKKDNEEGVRTDALCDW